MPRAPVKSQTHTSKLLLTATILSGVVAAVVYDHFLQPTVPTTGTQPTAVTHHWATWCAPCVKELPELITAARAHPTIPFMLIAYDPTPTMATFIQKLSPIPLPPNLQLTAKGRTKAPYPLPASLLHVPHSTPQLIIGPAPWPTLFPAPSFTSQP